METNKPKETKIIHALIPLIFLIVALIYGLRVAGSDPHIPIFTSAMVAVAIAVFVLKYKWEYISDGIFETIKMSLEAVIILMIIGMVVGSWITAGIVPAMIYYGLQIISPKIFLIASLIICSIVSLCTGSSWSTAATVGIAIIGIGEGLEVPREITAGAIISGAYFGDKLSPLSDTTNLAPAMAGSKLFDHIRHMLWTTVPSYIISLILFGIIGLKYGNKALNTQGINEILNTLKDSFYISPILFVVPILVLVLIAKKVPAIPALFLGSLLGGGAGMIFQRNSLATFMNSLHFGYTSETGNAMVDELLSRGGMDSMMWTVSLILCAMVLGGVMERTRMLNVIAEKILSYAKSTGGLVVATIISPIFVNLVASDQYLSIVIPGRMFKKVYEERGLSAKNLSRCLEDSGTLSSPLIPWNTCGAYMIATLGVAPWIYVPYCFLNIINPIISIIYGFTGFSMVKIEKEIPLETSDDAEK